jgi:NitT/TauT family transport system substrate-binding protein
MIGALHSRLFQASAAAALAVIIIALGYLGTRGQPPTQNSPAEKLSIALPVLPHYALVRRDHAIAEARDLAGKRIGVTFGTSGSYFLWALLIKHKFSPDSIALVDLPPDQLVGALASGSVDAVSTWQPTSFEAQSALGENALSFTDADAYRNTILAVGRNEFLKGHANAIEKFVWAMLKAEQFMRSRPEETQILTAEWLEIDVVAPRPTWKQFDFRINLLQSHLATMEDEARSAMMRGYAEKGPIPNFLPHLYLDALAAQPERVTVLR